MSDKESLSDLNQQPESRSWLRERVYEPRRARTAALVRQSVDHLAGQGKRVSLTSIVAQSKILDPEGRGVSQSAILANAEARTYYKAHRSWKNTSRQRSSQQAKPIPSAIRPLKPDRDTKRTQQRYMQMNKKELVERLIRVEQQYAEEREQWLQVNDELLMWRLRAEQAEQRCEKHQS